MRTFQAWLTETVSPQELEFLRGSGVHDEPEGETSDNDPRIAGYLQKQQPKLTPPEQAQKDKRFAAIKQGYARRRQDQQNRIGQVPPHFTSLPNYGGSRGFNRGI